MFPSHCNYRKWEQLRDGISEICLPNSAHEAVEDRTTSYGTRQIDTSPRAHTIGGGKRSTAKKVENWRS